MSLPLAVEILDDSRRKQHRVSRTQTAIHRQEHRVDDSCGYPNRACPRRSETAL